MHYLYGLKHDRPRRLVATFASEQQLLAYVRWSTLESHGQQLGKFEQGTRWRAAMNGNRPSNRSLRRIQAASVTIQRPVCCEGGYFTSRADCSSESLGFSYDKSLG